MTTSTAYATQAANMIIERDGLNQARAYDAFQSDTAARALAKRPAVVIADEPTAQLDTETAAGIVKLLRDVAAQGTAVLMATHDRVAVEFADRVATMEDGRLA